MGPLAVGLIGAGKHGSRYARHICRDLAGTVRLVAIARRSPEVAAAQAAEFGCRAYTDFRDLIAAADVEALIAVVPPTVHPAICAAAAAARKPVLFEKPAAASVADGRAMLRAARGAGIAVMVAQTLRFNSVVRAVLGARDSIGTIHAVRLSQRFEPSPLSWIDSPERSGGGMVLHTGVHSFDLLRVITGVEVERVYCDLAQVKTARTEDNFVAGLRLQGGILATVAGSRATRGRSGPIEVAGADATLHGDHVHGALFRIVGTSVTALPVAPAASTVREAVQAFATAVRAGAPSPVPLDEGLHAVAIAEACYRSASEGRPVAVENPIQI